MKKALDNWNVVATVYGHEFDEARRLLAPFGDVRRTDYYNVLAMRVGDVIAFLEALEETIRSDASIPNSVARIVPVTHTFRFDSPEEFETEARAVVDQWLPDLQHARFYVRMHRRGFRGRLSSQHEEQFLDHHLVEALQSRGSSARIDFDDPDQIIAVETLGQTAGLSRWSRRQLRTYSLLKLD
jgi:tRNA(Ser,Leu) C12 N-acetylase TAN1